MPGGTTLRKDDVPLLVELYQKATAAPKHVRVAVRRFGVSRREHDNYDRVMDLMSAAEALFLPGESNESAHKLALRAAFFSDKSVGERRAIFKVMKTAYSVRSKVAHGADPTDVKLVGFKGEALEPWNFVRVVDTFMRDVLVKVLLHGVPKPDWDEAIFASGQ